MKVSTLKKLKKTPKNKKKTIMLNINELSSPVKRQRMAEWTENKTKRSPNFLLSTRETCSHFSSGHTLAQSEGKVTLHEMENQRAGVATCQQTG